MGEWSCRHKRPLGLPNTVRRYPSSDQNIALRKRVITELEQLVIDGVQFTSKAKAGGIFHDTVLPEQSGILSVASDRDLLIRGNLGVFSTGVLPKIRLIETEFDVAIDCEISGKGGGALLKTGYMLDGVVGERIRARQILMTFLFEWH